MIIPAEAINAIRLLWGYYLCHVCILVALEWVLFSFGSMKTIVYGSIVLLAAILGVELLQHVFPSMGDASFDDIIIGYGTVIICFFMFRQIVLNYRVR